MVHKHMVHKFAAYFRVTHNLISSSRCLYVFLQMCADCTQQVRDVFVIKVACRFVLHIFVSQFEPTLFFWQRTRLNQQSVVLHADCETHPGSFLPKITSSI